MITYTLPGLIEFTDINLFFIEALQARPDMLLDDVSIESVYGGFAGSRLSGGRNNVGRQLAAGELERIFARYNDLGVACNVTFSNQLASADSLNESPYDREILDLLAGGINNGVIVYSDELAKAVRRDYPKLKLIASTTKALANPDAIARAADLYDRIVPDYNLAKDETALSNLPHPEALEIMVNEYCTRACPYREAHYRAVSESQLLGRQCEFSCRHDPAPQAYGFLQGLIYGDCFLQNEDVRRYWNCYGFSSFKIVGRGLERYDIVDSYLYYLVKPEYWYEFRDFLIHHDFF